MNRNPVLQRAKRLARRQNRKLKGRLNTPPKLYSDLGGPAIPPCTFYYNAISRPGNFKQNQRKQRALSRKRAMKPAARISHNHGWLGRSV